MVGIESGTTEKHILFIDDSPVMLRSVRSIVPKGYKVSIAINGAQAYKVMENSMPDLIFLDYEMPEQNGKELLTEFRSKDNLKDIPVYFMSAKAGDEYMHEVLDLNPAGFIIKPPSVDRIRAVIEKQLG